MHAETIRLMGVDFVPVGARGKTGPSEVHRLDPSPNNDQATTACGSASEPLKPRPAAVELKPSLDATPRLEYAPIAGVSPAGGVRDREENERQLAQIRQQYETEAPHRRFVTAHTNIVFGEGNACARLMFVGEAPGEEEDRTGRPFVGRAGQLLDKMIAAMGLKRQDVYIANVLKTRPPNNATPTLEEARLCAPYLFSQIRVISPEVIVTLGLPATRTILGTTETMGRLRGRWAAFTPPSGDREFAVMPTYHPAYLLRNYTPQERGKVWSDLRLVMDRLGLVRVSDSPGLG